MRDKTRMTAVHQELELIRELREELSLKHTLARAEARAEWEALEGRFQLAREEVERLGHRRHDAGVDLEHASRELLAEVRRGYERLRERR